MKKRWFISLIIGIIMIIDDCHGYRLAEMHRRICHALHDVHLAARMPRAFLNFIKNVAGFYEIQPDTGQRSCNRCT